MSTWQYKPFTWALVHMCKCIWVIVYLNIRILSLKHAIKNNIKHMQVLLLYYLHKATPTEKKPVNRKI